MTAVFLAALGLTSAAFVSGEAAAKVALLQSVRTGLENAPDVLREKEALRSAEASLLQAESHYDPIAGISSGYRKDAATAVGGGNLHTLSSAMSVTKQLPSGIAVAPEISLKRYDADSQTTNSVASAGITISIPLFKGLGNNNIYRSTRDAARESLEAERRSLLYAVGSSAYATATAYWTYVYAWRQLELNRMLRESAEAQLKATKALAEADQIAPFMIEQASAYLQQAQSSEIASVLAIKQAWHGLLLAMGMDPAGYPDPEAPLDSFPAPAHGFRVSLPAEESLQDMAAKSRSDLQSTRKRTAAASMLLDGYKNQLKPDFALALWGGYSGTAEGGGFGDYFSSASRNIPGSSMSATLIWTIDTGNRADRAAYMNQRAVYEQNRIREDELDRSVSSNVSLALAAVKNSADVYILHLRSTQAYRRLKEGELNKFRMGMSNIFNLQTASNNLAAAELQLLSAEKSFAQAVLDLRYATGTIVEERGGSVSIEAVNLTTVPIPEEARR